MERQRNISSTQLKWTQLIPRLRWTAIRQGLAILKHGCTVSVIEISYAFTICGSKRPREKSFSMMLLEGLNTKEAIVRTSLVTSSPKRSLLPLECTRKLTNPEFMN